jgi:hypothetical protein
MEPIFPVSALQKNQREVKDAAKDNVVRITENGAAAYVFCSEVVFEKHVQQAVEDALYEARLDVALEQGNKDLQEGRYFTNLDEAYQAAKGMRKKHA